MDKKEILYFEEDDASTVGNDGKQIFVAKRINGKVTHNKMEDVDGERKNILSKEDKKENESNKEIYIPQVKKGVSYTLTLLISSPVPLLTKVILSMTSPFFFLTTTGKTLPIRQIQFLLQG